MYPIFYYVGYRDRLPDLKAGKSEVRRDPIDEDNELEAAKQADFWKRKDRALSVAHQLGVAEQFVMVEAYSDELPKHGKYISLLEYGRPAIIVMDSLSMFLQQFGMSYWITLLRKSLQCGLLPITVEEYLRGVHYDYEVALRSRLITIEALTEHIRAEPKRVRGRRKLEPVADLIERILLESASRNINSGGSVMRTISDWYDETKRYAPERLQHDLIFSDKRWTTYKYKVRTMAKDLLREKWLNYYPEFVIQDDIWQASFIIDGQLVYPSAFAAVNLLPEFGYEKLGSQWMKSESERRYH